MARDLAEQERAFILALSADTGRDLDAWMQAIAASGHSARNDIIDWLRHQGFSFSNASWLERIHHNGGQLIYAGGETRAPSSGRAPQTRTKPAPETAASSRASTPRPSLLQGPQVRFASSMKKSRRRGPRRVQATRRSLLSCSRPRACVRSQTSSCAKWTRSCPPWCGLQRLRC